MIDIISRHGKEIIDNLHVDKKNLDIIHSESYLILPQNIPSFNKLWVSQIPFTSRQSIFEHYNPEFKYDEMTNNNLQIILKMIPVD
jgi:hypothetical protein